MVNAPPPTAADFDPLIALYNARRYADLESHMRVLLAKHPSTPFAWQLLGGALQMQGKDALTAFQKVAALSPSDAGAHFNLGVAYKSAGQLEQAVISYRRAVGLKPDYVEALSNLGNVLQDLGQFNEAVQCYRRALLIQPKAVDTLNNLGTALKDLGQLDEAVASYRLAIQFKPDYADAYYNLGNVLSALKQPEQAARCYQQAVTFKPDFAAALSNLGATLHELGRTEEALLPYQRSLEINPYSADTQRSLGKIISKREQFDQAMALFNSGQLEKLVAIENRARSLIKHFPQLAIVWQLLGVCLHQQGKYPEALPALLNAVKFLPDDAEVYYNLGITQASLGLRHEAVASYRHALKLNNGFAEAYNNLGEILKLLGQSSEAADCCRRALEIKPNYVGALNNLGNALVSLGQRDNTALYDSLGNTFNPLDPIHDALLIYRQALSIKPDYFEAHSNLLMASNYTQSSEDYLSPEDYLSEARRFGEQVAQKVTSRYTTWQCVAQPQTLRVGVVSADLNGHPVGYFIESFLAQLDPAQLELIAYSNNPKTDELTARIKPYFSAWKPVFALNDQATAQLIHDDGVHVLLDLSGHTSKNRLPVFAWKPAPVQASWLGYFASTGVAEIDHVIGDAYIVPPEDESHFSENIWRLPDSYLCFTPPNVAVEPGPLPALSSNKSVTFGCFNNLTKMNNAVVALWVRVLLAVPGSRLFLKTMQLNDAALRDVIRQQFAAHGITADRLILEGSSPRPELLAAYQRVDIALDPFPYPGGTTSAEALWMGVPVLTKRGDRFLSHMGESILHNAGLADWIADDDDDYVAKAIVHTADLNHLAALRAGLRQQVLASPLFEAKQFARNFEAAMWGMWQNWQEQHGTTK